MAEETEYQTVQRSRPPFAMTIELSEKAQISAEQAKKIIVEAISRIPAERLNNFRQGRITVIM